MSDAPGRDKWRPSLGLVIFTVLASVATLPLVGLFFFRLYDNQLIRQTQAELIAQSRVLATPARSRRGSTRASSSAPSCRRKRAPIRKTVSPRSGPRSISPAMIC